MKSIKIFATVGAIALLGTTGFTSCNQNNTPVGPDNLKEGEAVKTEFTIAIPEVAGGRNARYMPSTTAQVNPSGTDVFRGIQNIILIPYAANETSGDYSGAPKRGGKNIKLPNTPNDNTLNSSDINDKGAKVYSNVSIPLGTKNFLFYGEATSTAASDEGYHTFGVLTPQNTEAAPGSIMFDLKQINTKTPDTTEPIDDKGLVAYLNGIVIAADNQSKAWWDYAEKSPALFSIFQKFTSLTAGSSFSIQRTLTEVVKLLEAVKETGADTYGLVDAIEAKIEGTNNADATITKSGTVAGGDLSVTVELDDDHLGFPANVKLPEGAAGLKYTASTHTFALASTTNANGMPLNGEEIAVNHGLTSYVYPASLYYFVNSPVKVSDEPQSSKYASMTDVWPTFVNNNYTDGNAVTLTTRSVAIVNQIQYAVGRLDLKVNIPNGTLYYDDPLLAANAETGNKHYDITTGIPVSAVLVGGQKGVDYKFEPRTGTDIPVFTIYDNAVPTSWTAPVSTTDYSDINYTLVLETAQNAIVRIALELENNFGDFYNKHGQLIPQGGKFYLVGQLNPAEASDSEKAKTQSRVFKQDYFTQVSLSLGQKSLKEAYNTIPDLRATELELGLSVNLQWEEGMSFHVDF